MTVAVVLFVYIAIFVAVFLAYWWWKTRTLRKNLRDAAQSYSQPSHAPEGGYLIEGEVIREAVNVPKGVVVDVIAVQESVEVSHGRNR